MRTFLKWTVRIVLTLVLLVVIAGAALYVMGGRKIDRTYEIETAALTIPTDSASVMHGRHLAGINGCLDCHGPDLSGNVFADAPPFFMVASNLTRGEGGIGSTYTAEDWDRAIRHGVRPSGHALFIMPARAFHHIADDDMADLIAYLQRVPAVDNVLPASEWRPMGRVLSGGPMDPAVEVMTAATTPTAPPVGPTAEYGEYLVQTCAYCHGADLQGGEPSHPGAPPAPSLQPAGQWPLAVFTETLRTGVLPGGRRMNPEFMPWTFTARMTDTELAALHARLAEL